MTRITVRTDGGKVRIRLRDEAKAPVVTEATGATATGAHEPSTLTQKAVVVSKRLINLMEIRAESSFRPNQEDVELVYALSGAAPNLPDMLHKLSSNTVVEEATPDHIVSSLRGMMEHIVKERGSHPRLIIQVHTHPQSIPQPSEADKRYFKSVGERIRAVVSSTDVLFGIHAISSESIRERREPAKISRNTVKWSSITREHEIGFYTPASKPYEVEIIE